MSCVLFKLKKLDLLKKYHFFCLNLKEDRFETWLLRGNHKHLALGYVELHTYHCLDSTYDSTTVASAEIPCRGDFVPL